MVGKRAWLLFVAGFAAMLVLLTLLAAGAGVRGTDQYWYLEDVETLVRHGRTTTDTIFPVGLLGPGGTMSPPFIHNILSVYLAAVPALIVGAYGGWLILNLAAILATAVLIYLAARTVASQWAAVVCACAYPLLPVTFWHATQPLAEASTAFFAALAIYLLAVAGDRTARWLAVVGAVGLLYLSRESYLPLLLAVPVGFVVVRSSGSRGGLRRALAPTAVLAGAVAAVLTLERTVFGADNVAFSYSRLLNTAVPGQTDNMWFNFDLSSANIADRSPLAWNVIPDKFAGHLAEQFIQFDSLPLAIFYWTFNLLALVGLVMLWRCRHRPAELRIVVAALAVVAVHFVTITLFQNQVRYTVPALPGLLMVLAIALSWVGWLDRIFARHALVAAVLIVVVLIVPTAWLARTERSEAEDFGAAERAARTLIDAHVGPADPTMIVYAERPQVLAHATGDRPLLYVSASYDRAAFERLRAAFPSRWLLAPLDSPALAGLGVASTQPVGTVDAIGVQWGLYPLPS